MSRGKKLVELVHLMQRQHNSEILPVEEIPATNTSSELLTVVENVVMEITDVAELVSNDNNHEGSCFIMPYPEDSDVSNDQNIISSRPNSPTDDGESSDGQPILNMEDRTTTDSDLSSNQNGETDLISDEDSDRTRRLVPYSDHSDSDASSLGYPQKSKIRRKRFQVDKKTWISEQNKRNRERGMKYLGRKKKHDDWVYDIKKQPRFMKERCLCKETKKGRLKCSLISNSDRLQIFNYFWSLTWGEKRTLIDNTVSMVPINRPRNRKNAEVSRRSQSFFYHLRVNDDNIPVCRVMFLNTLSIGRMTVSNWKTQLGLAAKERKLGQKPDKSKKHTRKTFHAENEELSNFMKSLPTMESHYCRASSTKLYLLPEWQSKNCLYRFYADDWCKQKNVQPLSITTFNHTFDQLNMALYHPKKDQCEKCSAYKEGHVSEEEYNLHIIRKDEARLEKDRDKKNERLVFTLDLQAVLLAPKSKVSSFYYKTKLSVHNLCFYNLNNKDGFCYIWSEPEGGLNAEEFATIYACFITDKILPEIDRENNENPKIILYSDGCTYQNRNVTVSNALLNVALNEKIMIEQKYLEVGHTQMEADSMHATIERYLKEKTINVPAEYYEICRGARKNPKNYDVTYLNHTFFKKFDKIKFLQSIRPGKKKGDAKVSCNLHLMYLSIIFKGRLRYLLIFFSYIRFWTYVPSNMIQMDKCITSFDSLMIGRFYLNDEHQVSMLVQ